MNDPYVFFSGGIHSQWHPVTFYVPTKDGPAIRFNRVEQYIMYCKAIHFKDLQVAHQILMSNNPEEQKALGRQVRNFNDKEWLAIAERIVMNGNFFKYFQNLNLRKALLATEGTLVEATPDKRWGIGLTIDNKDIRDPSKWRGQNLLGKCLTAVRNELAKDIPTTVVNIHKDNCDVYIGRHMHKSSGTDWGNPYPISETCTREQSIRLHEAWIHTQPNLIAKLHTLRGKQLGCFCKPEPCHGDTLAGMANGTVPIII